MLVSEEHISRLYEVGNFAALVWYDRENRVTKTEALKKKL